MLSTVSEISRMFEKILEHYRVESIQKHSRTFENILEYLTKFENILELFSSVFWNIHVQKYVIMENKLFRWTKSRFEIIYTKFIKLDKNTTHALKSSFFCMGTKICTINFRIKLFFVGIDSYSGSIYIHIANKRFAVVNPFFQHYFNLNFEKNVFR